MIEWWRQFSDDLFGVPSEDELLARELARLEREKWRRDTRARIVELQRELADGAER